MNPEDVVRLMAEHTYGTWRPQEKWKSPLFIGGAEGVYLYDEEGNAYLDFSSQLMCSNLGHGNKAITDAICDQARTLPYVSPGFVCEAKAQATEALLEVMPEGLDQLFFSTSGTEANEAAVKILRQYKAPDYKIISRYRSYHGATAASISLTGDPRRWYAEQARCTVPGVIFAPDPYCYRCPFNLQYPGCDVQCVEYVDYMIKEEGNVAAVLVEPVVGTNGKIVPPKEYYPGLREICDENDVLLVADEVMSGWYRTGPMWALDNWDVRPDILTTAKGCTSAYAPAGITATTGEIRDYFEERVMCHGHTYAMHPLVLAAIPAAVDEYRKLMATGLPQRVSKHIEKRLFELMEDHISIGDVRGIGHFWAVEIVKNRETKEPFNVKADKFVRPLVTDRISSEALRRGLYIHNWYDHFTVSPPLTITEDEVDRGLAVLDEVLRIADEKAAG
ncbi:MAG: aminotransferase class III-fold pyridoxal phosphate-dependent enzyme [Anaerolineae bacterium]|jgi:taurine--2-oxoglutarate transaminase